jgi:dTDP-4-dehydrorhamnose reductase
MTDPSGDSGRHGAGVGAARPAVELWGGVEYTVNRVGDRWFDQTAWSGHDRRYDDIDLFHTLGLRTLRCPVLWEQVAPDGLAHADWRASDERLHRMRALGMRPIVGLVHHGSGPRETSLLDPQFPARLAAYARAVAERYPWVIDYTPVNEPLTTARFSGLYGHWYPHCRSNRDYVRALLHQVRGVVLAMHAIREVVPGARLVQTEDCGRTFGTTGTRTQVHHEVHRRWLTWDLLTGRVDARHPLFGFLRGAGMTADDVAFFRDAACAPDVIGLNYYLTSDRYLDERLAPYPPAAHGGNGHMRYADVEAVRARSGGIAGHEAHLMAAWRRYGLPLAITEVHLGCTREEQMRWLMEAWRAAQAARSRGADVRAVTAWALLGSFNWDSLVTRDAGHYEAGAFDVRGTAPRRTAVGAMIADLARGVEPRHPALHGRPWWRRPERLVYAAASQPRATADDAVTGPTMRLAAPGGTTALASRRRPAGDAEEPPLLIVGAGTLGRAFARICSTRGLRAHVAHRGDADFTDASAVQALIARTAPWAVVNAAGYVRVETAERERDLCRLANVVLPQHLAAACRGAGIPLLTFSSHLVFDGREARAYTEHDEPRPLNVYGRSKHEGEQRVLDLLPEALVIRSGAFFGPWDDRTFLAGLLRTLDAGHLFPAAADTIVSPTYVPDLVHASLDLLVDGERGLWHVTNGGATTLFAFARAAAERIASPAGLVVPVAAADAWPAVVRPRYSALVSARARLLRDMDAALSAWAIEAGASRESRRMDVCA